MANTWFVVRGGKEEGPLTGQQLKDMAAAGKLRETDLVRRDDMPTARQAKTIKGLFPGATAPAPAAPPPLPAKAPEQPTDPPTKQGKYRRPLVLASVVGGVCLLLCCGGFGVLFTFALKEQRAVHRELAEADALWQSGDKAGAVTKYRAMIEKKSVLPTDQKAVAYGRVIDFDMEGGNSESAKQLMAGAVTQKVSPQVHHPEAKALLAAEEARVAREQAVEQARAKGEVLTAEFYPFKRGASFRSTKVVFFDFKDKGGKTVRGEKRSSYECTNEADGVTTIRQQDHYLMPGHVTLALLGPTKQLHRERDGYVEVGDPPDADLLKDVPALKQNEDFMQTRWHPIVKVGAVFGEEWERSFGPKSDPGLIVERYKLVRFAAQEVEFKGGAKEKATVAFVEMRMTTKLDGGRTMETGRDLQLARGVGLVHQNSWGLEQGQRKDYWYEHFTPSK
jgi:hypothetical protein